VDPAVETIHVFNFSSWFLADSEKIDAIFGQNHEVIGLEQEASDRRFPELVPFMPIFDELGLQIDYSHIECVYTNAFIAHDYGAFQFLCSWTNFPHDGHVTVTDIQLGRPIDKILIFLSVRILNVNLDKIIA
jgi:hypothetical protein